MGDAVVRDVLVIPIHNFVRKYLAQSTVSVDPFARNCQWATYTNDLNPGTRAQCHMEAAEFLHKLVAEGVKADLVLFDPPYSPRQVMECYQAVGKRMTTETGQMTGSWGDCRDAIDQLCTQDGIVLSFGWNSMGMGRKHGFDIEELLLVCHGAQHNDTICVAERRVQPHLFGERAQAAKKAEESTEG
jgi:hypothetical protein